MTCFISHTYTYYGEKILSNNTLIYFCLLKFVLLFKTKKNMFLAAKYQQFQLILHHQNQPLQSYIVILLIQDGSCTSTQIIYLNSYNRNGMANLISIRYLWF